MKGKIRVGVLFGGKSAEHEVSLQSAKNVIEAIDKEKYEVIPVFIDQQGNWQIRDQHNLTGAVVKKIAEFSFLEEKKENNKKLSLLQKGSVGEVLSSCQVIFPVLHGTYGEDGTIQGLLQLADVPFVGADVLGSAVGMDKDVMKRLLRDAGIPVAKFLVITSKHLVIPAPASPKLPAKGEVCQKRQRGEQAGIQIPDQVGDDLSLNFTQIANDLGLPFFLKPANAGSSVGVHKIHSREEFAPALRDAFTFDNKVIIEEYISGKEIECAVLGNDHPRASIVGEIIPSHEFYDYEAKYLDPNGAALRIPAQIDGEIMKKAQQLALKTFEVLCCSGMARVDMFLTSENQLYVNEINTIPGFTQISMYPKLWEASGMTYTLLIDTLIRLAIEKHTVRTKLKTVYS